MYICIYLDAIEIQFDATGLGVIDRALDWRAYGSWVEVVVEIAEF